MKQLKKIIAAVLSVMMIMSTVSFTAGAVSVNDVFTFNNDLGYGTNSTIGQFKFYVYNNTPTEAGTNSFRLAKTGAPASAGNPWLLTDGSSGTTKNWYVANGSGMYIKGTSSQTNLITFTAPAEGRYSLETCFHTWSAGAGVRITVYKAADHSVISSAEITAADKWTDINGSTWLTANETVIFEFELMTAESNKWTNINIDKFNVKYTEAPHVCSYTDHYTSIDGSSHNAYCSCGESISESHTFGAETTANLNKNYVKVTKSCTKCEYSASTVKFVPSYLNTKYTFNSSLGFGTQGTVGQFKFYTFSNTPTVAGTNSFRLTKTGAPASAGNPWLMTESNVSNWYNSGMYVQTKSDQTNLIAFTAPYAGKYRFETCFHTWMAASNADGVRVTLYKASDRSVLATAEITATDKWTDVNGETWLSVNEVVIVEIEVMTASTNQWTRVQVDKFDVTYTEAPAHTCEYTNSYASVDGSSHNAYCICGEYVSEAHTFGEETRTDLGAEYVKVTKTCTKCEYSDSTVEFIPSYLNTVYTFNNSLGYGTAGEIGQFKFYIFSNTPTLDGTNSFRLIKTGVPESAGNPYLMNADTAKNWYKQNGTGMYIQTKSDQTNLITFTAPYAGKYSFETDFHTWMRDAGSSGVRVTVYRAADHEIVQTVELTVNDAKAGVGGELWLEENETVIYEFEVMASAANIWTRVNINKFDVTYTEAPAHTCDFTASYGQLDDTNHTAYCVCGNTSALAHVPSEAAKENDGTDGYDTVIRCADCDYVISSEHVEVAKISAANVEISDRFTLFFLVDTATIDDVVNGGGSYEFKITFGEVTVVYSSLSSAIKEDGRYLFYAKAVGAQVMGREFTATLTLTTADGTTYVSKPTTYSVKQYISNKLAELKDASTAKDIAFRTALADMLVYGAAAQVYSGYDIENLVTNGEEEYLQYASTEQSYTTCYAAQNARKSFKWKSVNILLDDGINLVYTVKIPKGTDVNTLSIRLSKAGISDTYTFGGSSFIPVGGDGTYDFYQVVINVLGLAEADTAIEAYIYQGETQVSGILRYSVESYASVKAGTTDFGKLVDAMMKFGRSIRTWIEQ